MSDDFKKKSADPAATKEETDTSRFLNIGIPVELTFGTYRVQELDIFSLMAVIADGYDVFMQMAENDETTSDVGFLKDMVRKPEFKSQVLNLFALYCGTEDTTPFSKIGLADFSKLLVAIKEVTDFDEIKTAFLELGLQKYLPMTATPTSTDAPQ